MSSEERKKLPRSRNGGKSMKDLTWQDLRSRHNRYFPAWPKQHPVVEMAIGVWSDQVDNSNLSNASFQIHSSKLGLSNTEKAPSGYDMLMFKPNKPVMTADGVFTLEWPLIPVEKDIDEGFIAMRLPASITLTFEGIPLVLTPSYQIESMPTVWHVAKICDILKTVREQEACKLEMLSPTLQNWYFTIEAAKKSTCPATVRVALVSSQRKHSLPRGNVSD